MQQSLKFTQFCEQKHFANERWQTRMTRLTRADGQATVTQINTLELRCAEKRQIFEVDELQEQKIH